MKKIILTMALLPFAFSAWATAYGSVGISADLGYVSVADVPSFSTDLGFSSSFGSDFGGPFGVHFRGDFGVIGPLVQLHPFLDLVGITRWGLGGGVRFFWKPFILSLDQMVDVLDVNRVKILSLRTVITPKILLFELVDGPIGYSVSFPIQVIYGAGTLRVGMGIAFTMDIGRDIGGIWQGQ